MNEDRNIVEEEIPAGVVTMLLTGYLETNKRLTWALVIAIIALLCSWGDFCIIFLNTRLMWQTTVLLRTAM